MLLRTSFGNFHIISTLAVYLHTVALIIVIIASRLCSESVLDSFSFSVNCSEASKKRREKIAAKKI